MISFLHQPGCIYHILHNDHAHRLLKIVSRDVKFSFVITAITTIGLMLHHCGVVSFTLRVSL